MFDQFGNVLFSVPKGRQENGKHIDAVVQILPEVGFFNGGFQITIGGRNDTCFHLKSLRAAQTLEDSVLKNAQKFRLKCGAQITDFVQENCSIGSQFKAPGLASIGSRKCTLFVAEQFTLQKIFRNGRTIHSHKRLFCPVTVAVNRQSNQFLSGSAFSPNQNRRIDIGHLFNQLKHILHGTGMTNDIFKRKPGLQLFSQANIFPLQGFLF